jgi:hypothetical protein
MGTSSTDMKKIGGLALAFFFTIQAQAKIFSNSYISFELPPSWDCTREGTEWTCASSFSQKSKEGIIILTAKEVGPADTLAQYTAHLKEPRVLPTKSGPAVTSKVLHVQTRTINNHPWVDSLHLGSEVGSYYTRYLATVKDRVAILITFSAHRTRYTQYSNDFIHAVDSLKVTANKETLGTNPTAGGPARAPEIRGPPIPPVISGPDSYPPEGTGQSGGGKRKLFGLALILMAIGIFLYLRSQRKAKKRKDKH